MRCPKCGNEHCTIINEIETNGKDYGVGKGIIGTLLLGPVGLLCGFCGEKQKTKSKNYWICNRCGYKWRA